MTQLLAGTLLNGTYTVESLLGKGGMGTVYLAREMNNPEKKYAIKELISSFPDPKLEEVAHKTFQTEITFLSQLNHPQLPKIYATFSQLGRLYLVMEYVEGDSLEKLMEKDKKPFPENNVLDWAMQLAAVLNYLHNHSAGPIVYRDLKPANIIITPMGVAKLVDLGIARRYEAGKLTDTLRFGTPGYAAPEQFKGMGQSTPKTDIYGLGVIMFQLLTTHDPTITPFKFPPMKGFNQEISSELEKIITRAIQRKPEDRYESMAVFRDTLSMYSRGKYKKDSAPEKQEHHLQTKSSSQMPQKPFQYNIRHSEGKLPLPLKFISSLAAFAGTFLIVGGLTLANTMATFSGAGPEVLSICFWVGIIPAVIVALIVLLGDFRLY